MRTVAILSLFALVLPMPRAWAGAIVGTVRAKPASQADESATGDRYQSRRYKFAEKIDYDHLRDFVIYLEADPKLTSEPGGAAAKIVQKDASFEPHVLPIAAGTTVKWPNEDEIFHNVFSMSETKEFNLGFYNREKIPAITFDKAGRVDVFCGIHTNMHCIILVLPNRFFVLADSKGRFAIREVPAGTYKLKAWHERVPGQVKEVVVPESGEVSIDFVLGVGELPKY
jgi:plastocyanin